MNAAAPRPSTPSHAELPRAALDKRFKSQDWQSNPLAQMTAQQYLWGADWMRQQREAWLKSNQTSAEQAAQWGLIWASVEDGGLMSEAQRLALRLAALPAHSAQETRALFRAAGANALPEQLMYEMQRQRVLLNGESFAEGLAAFQGKRKAEFAPRR